MSPQAVQAFATVMWWAGVIGAWVIANGKGWRGWAYGLFAALMPIVGLVVAVVVPERRRAA